MPSGNPHPKNKWKPGQSGNPKGRPIGTKEERAALFKRIEEDDKVNHSLIRREKKKWERKTTFLKPSVRHRLRRTTHPASSRSAQTFIEVPMSPANNLGLAARAPIQARPASSAKQAWRLMAC